MDSQAHCLFYNMICLEKHIQAVFVELITTLTFCFLNEAVHGDIAINHFY